MLPARRMSHIAACLLVAFGLTACGIFSRKISDEQAAANREAGQLLLSLSRTNKNLSAFKGVGQIKIWSRSRPPISERVAWIGAVPMSLRIVVLASGRPIIKFASDGRYLYFVDLQNSRPSLKKVRSPNASLRPLISMPVKSSDIIDLLSGRPPILRHSDVSLEKDIAGRGYILILEKWWQVVEKVYLNEDKSEIHMVEILNSDNELQYRVEFNRMQEIQGYRVPSRLTISDDNGAGIQLDIDRYIADISVNPSMFVLSPPDSY